MKEERSLAMTFGFIAGYVDTVGFVALFGVFTAHVTGNFVLIGSELIHPANGVLIKLLPFPAFIAAVALARFAALRLELRQTSPALALTAMQLFLLLGFMALGCLATPVQQTGALLPFFASAVGAAAMGVQNAASRLVWTQLAPTTVMTGNVTQVVIDTVDILRGGQHSDVTTRVWKFLLPVLAFGVGAILGALAYRYAGFFSLAVPSMALGVVLLRLAQAPGRHRAG